MNVLVVDDDKLDRMQIKRTLSSSNLEVNITEALTVDEGLAAYSEGNFDVVLLDYRMPQRDGIEMIVEIRNEPKESSTAIVMMSSSEDEELAINCIKAGAQDFLIKSEITESRLRRAIQHATTRFELEQQLFKTYQKVKALAETDTLTNLPNRYYFDETLKQAIANNQRNNHKLALLLIDLDNFKLVNDSFGHDVGDLLLKKIVSRIKGCLRGSELFARLGGDEFAITLSSLEYAEHANLVARRIITLMQKPVEIVSTPINATCSIGISLHPDNGVTSEELFKCADIAMYKAKKLGRNQVCFFETEMQYKFQNRLRIESELRTAITNNELEVYYQPIVRPKNGELKGFEALIRWNIDGKIRAPDQFIQIAEESNQISDIGVWIMESVIHQLSLWNTNREKPLRAAINISSSQLYDFELVDKLKEFGSRYSVDLSLIDIELTETVLLENTKVVKEVIIKLTELGCRISLDDFGTGFSSLSHLRHYPISTLKIDRSLMPKSIEDTKNKNIVEGVTSMAKILKLEIVAEGVEEESNMQLCEELGIDFVQGYFISKPIPSSEAEKLFL
ncbi:EAL domain-containing protein [Aliikangiella maris]|uniref:EAL domain-containing protein n=2 Tax=Aliikangiella maris TaxID=3162458 RepID=A0ABV3MJL5_9GAMM